MLTTQRFSSRVKDLSEAISVEKMLYIWERHVRSDMRRQALFDLHDYYDFQLMRKSKIKALHSSICDGGYKPRRAIRIRKEKGKGVCRHLVVLCPEDALVIEALGQYLYDFVDENAVADTAFFSRRHGKNNKNITDLDEHSPYTWWELWPHFQNKIQGFARVSPCVVVTDIANYYDTIDFGALRRKLASIHKLSEGFLDFLFYTLERFAWRPDYLPHPGRGLPQINLEAPRVLAHAFLFDVDSFLKTKTVNNYTRWMDDIDFGCESEDAAKKILRDLDELLLSKGLHVNSSKTKILNALNADRHFYFNENRWLTVLCNSVEGRIENGMQTEDKRIVAVERYEQFIKTARGGQIDKVRKRYFKLFGMLGSEHLEDSSLKVLVEEPSLRQSVFSYFSRLGWSIKRQGIVERYIATANDDEGVLLAVRLLLDWVPTYHSSYLVSMRSLSNSFANSNNTITLLCGLWIRAKYSKAADLDSFVMKYASIWRSRDWLARQFVSVWPRLSASCKANVERIVHSHGLSDARSVVDNFIYIQGGSKELPNKIFPYLKVVGKGGTYPLYKILIAASYLSGKSRESEKLNLLSHLEARIADMRALQLLTLAMGKDLAPNYPPTPPT